MIALRKFGLPDVRDQHERIQEQAFGSEHKFMSVKCRNSAGAVTLYMKVCSVPCFAWEEASSLSLPCLLCEGALVLPEVLVTPH